MDESLLKKMGLKEGMTFCAINPIAEFDFQPFYSFTESYNACK